MYIKELVVGQIGTNCYIVAADDSNECVVIDPGDDGDDIIYEAGRSGRIVTAVLLTHGHFDHISGLEAIKQKARIRILAYEGEKELLLNPSYNLTNSYKAPLAVKADEYLVDNDTIRLAGLDFHVIFTPGHTSGSVCYYVEEEKVLFSGDTLFEMSVGRSDFPTGSSRALINSIRDRLYVLPDDVKVYPGHGGTTSIGYEKHNNMFA